MKNTLTKTLLCGVLASTFFLINCQKAPSRGVKAGTGAGAAQTQQEKLSGKSVVDCTDIFIKALDEARVAKDKILANVKAAKAETKKLTETEKAEIKTVREDIIAKNKIVRSEMDKMKKGDVVADACTKDKDAHIFEEIKNGMDNLVIEAGNVIDIDDEATKNAKSSKTEREKKKEATSLVEKTKLIVSSDLAAALKNDNKGGVYYFKDGEIVKATGSELETLKKDKTKTVCELESVTPEDLSISADDKLTFLNTETKKMDSRNLLTVKLMKSESQLYMINCLIAEGKVAETEFRLAFKDHLQTQAQIDKKVDSAKTTLEKAQADLDKKVKANDLAIKAAKEAKEAYDAKLVDIDAAREKKDEKLVDSLVAKAGPFKIKMEKTEKEAAAALKAKDAAQKKVDDLK